MLQVALLAYTLASPSCLESAACLSPDVDSHASQADNRGGEVMGKVTVSGEVDPKDVLETLKRRFHGKYDVSVETVQTQYGSSSTVAVRKNVWIAVGVRTSYGEGGTTFHLAYQPSMLVGSLMLLGMGLLALPFLVGSGSRRELETDVKSVIERLEPISRVMVNCAVTGKPVFTGARASKEEFESGDYEGALGGFGVRCPHCNKIHEWHGERAYLEGQ